MEFAEDIIAEVKEDFNRKREQRRALELNWRLNMNFLLGNQYCFIENGDIIEKGKQYFWQEREVYNHIAPIVETRLSKLARVKASVSVRPSTNDDDDVNSAKFATSILKSICAENRWSSLMSEANMWSEGTGTAFYKVVWDNKKGKAIDAKKGIYEGDVAISVCPPFEIYPESLTVSDISEQESIIHAKVYGVEEIERIWGVKVEGEKVNVFSMDNASVLGGFGYNATVPKIMSEQKENAAVVIERYVPPEQGVDFRNGDMFDAEVIEGSFDKLTAITQQLTEIASRSFKLPVSESPTDLVFPGPTERAGKIIGFGDDGNEVVMYSNFEGAVEASEEARKTLLQIIEIQGQIQTDKEEVTDLHAQMEGMLHPGLRVTVGNGTDTEFLIEHNLNTEWTNTQVWYSDPENEGVPYLIQELDKNRMKITFKSPPPIDGAEVRIISCDRVNVIDLLPDGFTLMPDQIAPDCALSSEEIASVIGTSIQNNLSKEN